MSNKRRHPTVSKLDYIKLHNSSKDEDKHEEKATTHKEKVEKKAVKKEEVKAPAKKPAPKKHHAPHKSTKKEEKSSQTRELVLKEFVDDEVEEVTEKKKKKALPSFLKSFGSQKEEVTEDSVFEQPAQQRATAADSLGNLFAQDQEKVQGVQRVFRKSLTFLIFSMLSFGILVFSSINLFAIPWYVTLLSAIGFVAFTSIFFVILADRSYMWLSLFGIVSIFLVAQLVLGQLLSPVTIVGAFAFSVFYYLSYADLERMQMGARLFNIRNITQQTVQALIWCSIMVISLGVFNTVVSEGTEQYFQRAFLSNEFIVENVIIGRNARFNLNVLLDVKVPERAGTFTNPPLLIDFLEQNYNRGEDVLSPVELSELDFQCRQERGDDPSCETIGDVEVRKIITEWKKDEFADLDLALETPLTPVNYYETLSAYYSFRIRSFEASAGSVSFLDSSFILPSAVTLFVLAALCVGWIIWSWLINAAIFIIWRILRIFGFAKIDVENVEAEIVSI